jgi:hypothetical protein
VQTQTISTREIKKCSSHQPKISIRISPVLSDLSRVSESATGESGQLNPEATPETHKIKLMGFLEPFTSDNIYVDIQSFSRQPSETPLKTNRNTNQTQEQIHYPARALRGGGFFKRGLIWIAKSAYKAGTVVRGGRWAYVGNINVQSAKFVAAFRRGKTCALSVRIPRIYKGGRRNRISESFSRMRTIFGWLFGKKNCFKPNFTPTARWRFFSEV